MKVRISGPAREQIDGLVSFYLDRDRPEAAMRLSEDVRDAWRLISSDPEGGSLHPRPYPELAGLGHRWRLCRAYWVAWTVIDGQPTVTNVFHVSANIVGRATSNMDGVEDW